MNTFFISLYFGWFGRCVEDGILFCESMHPGLIKQPANTWSNLGFVVVGLFVAWSLTNGWYHHNRNTLTQSQFYGTLLSCLMVLLGPGAMALHASGSYMASVVDRRSMYLIGSFTIAYATLRLFLLGPVHFVLIFFFVFNTCVWAEAQSDVHFIFYSFNNTVFVFYILLSVLFELLNIIVRKQHYATVWAFAAIGSLMPAFFIWKMSLTGNPWCDPDSIIQGHAIQHVLDAFALYCLFRFYVSEDCQPRFKACLHNV